METITSLLGNKMFASMYDPKADKLAADFRARAASSLGGLTSMVSKGDETKNILNKIPGVSADTKASLDNLLAQTKSFTSSAAGSTPNTIAAKKDEVDAKMKEIVKKAQTEAKDAKVKDAAAKKETLKEKIANQTFSITRLMGRIWNQFKIYLLYLLIVILALWGGSMTSNAMFEMPVYMRFYYFVYGTLLFPVAFIFAIMRYTTGASGKYHAILAPLVEGPIMNPILAGLLYPFTHISAEVLVTPLPVESIDGAHAVSESLVMAQAQQNAFAQAQTQAQTQEEAAAKVGLIGTSV
jgi:hypothetical protein